MRKYLIILTLPMFLISCFKKPVARTQVPDDVFKNIEGFWKGSFKVFDRDFKLLKEIKVVVKYKRQGKKRLLGWGKEVHSNGKVVTYEADEIINNNLIVCNIRKAGKLRRLLGSYKDNAFVYMWSKGNDLEVFHEKVIGDTLFISGYAIYSGKVYYMNANYKRSL
jgi:hypothetical protein